MGLPLGGFRVQCTVLGHRRRTDVETLFQTRHFTFYFAFPTPAFRRDRVLPVSVHFGEDCLLFFSSFLLGVSEQTKFVAFGVRA